MTLADMRHFYGELKDDSDSQKKFRDYLLRDTWQVEHFERWMTEALHEKLPTEFQDLVVAFGKKLGFEVEFGTYGPHGTGYDGIWLGEDGTRIVIESKSATWPGLDVRQLGNYMNELLKKFPADKVFGLYVLGDDSKMQVLANQIRGSEFAHRMRLILHKDLIGLGNIKGVANLSASQVSNFLVPVDAINVGELVKLVDTIILEKRIAEETPQPKPEAREISERQVATVKRSELKLADGELIICPSKPDGVKFLLTYEAWGFIGIKRTPKYLALYVSRPYSEVQYIAEVDRIMDPLESSSPVPDPEKFEQFEPGKKLVVLKTGTIRKLVDPIKLGEAFPPVRSRYTTLSKLIEAKDLDEVF